MHVFLPNMDMYRILFTAKFPFQRYIVSWGIALKSCPRGGDFEEKNWWPGAVAGGGVVTGLIDTCISLNLSQLNLTDSGRLHCRHAKDNQTPVTFFTTVNLSELPCSHECKYGAYQTLFSYFVNLPG